MHRAPAPWCRSRRDRHTSPDRRYLRSSPLLVPHLWSLPRRAIRTLRVPVRLRLPVALPPRSRYRYCLAPQPLPLGRLTSLPQVLPLHLRDLGIVFGWNLSCLLSETWCLRTSSGHSSSLRSYLLSFMHAALACNP